MNLKAEEEINTLFDDMLAEGMPADAGIMVDDVRKLMILSWERGYAAYREEVLSKLPHLKDPKCPTCED